MPTSQRVLIRRGETSKSSATARRKFDDNDSIDNSTTDDNYKTFTMNNTSLNDTKLCGTHKLITLQSAQYAIHLVSEFMRETAPQDDKQKQQQQRQKKTSSSSSSKEVTFTKDLFDPLWQRLKDQGGGGISTTTRNNCSWRVSKSNNLLNPLSISRNWVYVPPKSTLTKLDDTKAATNNKGSTSSNNNKQSKYKLGRDYYISEEQVVLNVLEDISTLDEVFDLYAMNAHYFSCIIPILDKAVTYNLKYKDAYAAWIGDDDHSDNDDKQRKSTLPLDQHKSAKSKKRKSPRSSKGRTSYNDYGDYQYYDPDEWEKAGMEDNDDDDDDDDDGNKDECDACGEGGGEVMLSTLNIHAVFIPSLFYLCI